MLTVCGTVTALCSAVCAEESEDIYTEAAACLEHLGAVEYTAETDLQAVVTREQYCEILSDYFGIVSSPNGSGATTPFIDVDVTRESYGVIRTMYDRGFISGDDEKKFYPEQDITVAQAITILVRMIGHGYEASLTGYPQGYMNVASNYDIIYDGLGGIDDTMTLGAVYRILYNTLDAPVVTFEMDGGNQTYTWDPDVTVLTAYFKAEKKEGIVTADEYSGLTSGQAATVDGRIEIDGVSYKLSADYSNMLGKNVEYYVSYKNEDDGEVVYMKEKNNNIVEINTDYIDEINDTSLTYYPDDGSKKKTEKLSDSIDVIYNGKAYTGYGSLRNIELYNGNVCIIDNNNDGLYEVINITEYTDYYIGGTDKANKIVYDYSNEKELSMNDSENTVEIYDEEGNRIGFSELKANTLISVLESKDENYRLIKAYVCSGSVNGSVDGINDDTYNISGAEYKKAHDMKQELKLGQLGTFLIDKNGKIAAYVNEIDNSIKYAVVYKVVYEPGEEKLSLKLFSSDAAFVSYELKPKLSLNGSKVEIQTESGRNEFMSAVTQGMVIAYKLNEEGVISVLDTPVSMIEDTSGNKHEADTEDFRVIAEGSSFKYRNGLLDGKVIINEDTLIFGVPKSDNWSLKDNFNCLSASSFSGGSSYSKVFKAYVTGENAVNIADILLIEDMTKGGIGNGTNMVLVTNLLEGINTEGDICDIIEGVSAGNKVEYYCTDESLIEDNGITSGDIIRVGVDAKSNVNKIQKIYNSDGSNSYGALLVPSEGISENTSSFDSEFRVAAGYMQDLSDNYMKFTMKKKSGDEYYDDVSLCQVSGATVVKYEADNPKADPTPCSVNEILKDDFVIIRMSLASAKEIIIIR